jgi:hypothetical protein
MRCPTLPSRSPWRPSRRQSGGTKLVVPTFVEGLVELTHQLRVGGVNKAGGLAAADRLGEGIVEEDILDMQLVHRLTPG